MENLTKFKLFISIIFTTISITLGYELKDSLMSIMSVKSSKTFIFFVTLLNIIISNYFADFIVKKIFNIKYVRKLILSEKWVEGFWIIKMFDPSNLNIVTGADLVEMAYVNDGEKLRISTYSLSKTNQLETRSISKSVDIIGDDLRYSNYFTYISDRGLNEGFFYGQFFFKIGSKYPTVLGGISLGLGAYQAEKHIGEKIPIEKIKEFQKKHIKEWEKAIILNALNEDDNIEIEEN